jgi:hypothetical protein
MSSSNQRSSRPPPAPAPSGFEVRADGGRREVRADGGRAISRHAELRDALTLAASLAKRVGASLVIRELDGTARPIRV